MTSRERALRQAFLHGYLDALDAANRPTVDYGGDDERQAAWQAGWDHFHKLVRQEQARLERAVASGEGFLE